MDIWRAIRTIGRRWYISLVVVILCAAATSSLVASADVTYTSGATLILLPPSLQPLPGTEVTNDDSPTNPFLQIGIPMATAVASAANSDRIADLLKAAELTDVTFVVGNLDTSPILFITVESHSAAEASAGIDIVIEGVQNLTRELQQEAQAPGGLFITAQLLAPPPGVPAESLAAKTKIAMGMAVVSFLAVVCAALLFDNLAVRLAQRRDRRALWERTAGALVGEPAEFEDDAARERHEVGSNGDREAAHLKVPAGR